MPTRPPRPAAPQDAPKLGAPWLLVALVALVTVVELVSSRGASPAIPYSEFLKAVDGNEIVQVSIGESRITGERKAAPGGSAGTARTTRFVTVPVGDPTLPARLEAHGVAFSAEPRTSPWGAVLPWVLPLLVLWSLGSAFSRGAIPSQALGMTKSKARLIAEKDVKTTFADVAGVDEAKEELRETVDFLRDPKRYSRLGGRAPKGVLLVGPPGTGKTLLARALAGEAHVPFFLINGSEFVELFVGLGAARVRDLFEQARKQAPCILFIDEIDALGKSRALDVTGSGANEEKEQTLNQLLAEMDGFDSSEGVIILAATNRPEILDPALLRAGRFDRQILVALPDLEGRSRILAVHAKKIRLQPGTKLETIASLTPGFSGADLANLVNEAAIFATRRGADGVAEQDFTLAIERIVAGLERKRGVMNPGEKRRIAYHEMGHAAVTLALRPTERVHKISILPRGMGALGYTLHRPTEDRYLMDRAEMIARIAVLLGGRASEETFFEEVSTGAADDLAKATDLARAMVMRYGMSEKIGLASLERSPTFLGGAPGATAGASEATAREIDAEVRRFLGDGLKLATHAVREHREFIEEGARRLLDVETLDEKAIRALWGRATQAEEEAGNEAHQRHHHGSRR